MSTLTRCLLPVFLVLSICAVPSPAGATVITFGEVAPQTLDGLTILGVTFDFKVGGVDSLDATVGLNSGPGATPFNSPPNAEGDAAGILTLDFAEAATSLSFGSHLSTGLAVSPGLTVQLYDLMLVPIGGPIPLNMVPSPGFAGGLFSISGVLFSRAVIDFNQAAALRFTVDNVTFDSVPEPATMILIGSGLAAAVARRRIRKARA